MNTNTKSGKSIGAPPFTYVGGSLSASTTRTGTAGDRIGVSLSPEGDPESTLHRDLSRSLPPGTKTKGRPIPHLHTCYPRNYSYLYGE
jgi:hypothetical protein